MGDMDSTENLAVFFFFNFDLSFRFFFFSFFGWFENCEVRKKAAMGIDFRIRPERRGLIPFPANAPKGARAESRTLYPGPIEL